MKKIIYIFFCFSYLSFNSGSHASNTKIDIIKEKNYILNHFFKKENNSSKYNEILVKRKKDLRISVPRFWGGIEVGGFPEILKKLSSITGIRTIDNAQNRPNFVLVIHKDFLKSTNHKIVDMAVKIMFLGRDDYIQKFKGIVEKNAKCLIWNNYDENGIYFTSVFINISNNRKTSAVCLSKGLLSSFGMLNFIKFNIRNYMTFVDHNKYSSVEIDNIVFDVLKDVYDTNIKTVSKKEEIVDYMNKKWNR